MDIASEVAWGMMMYDCMSGRYSGGGGPLPAPSWKVVIGMLIGMAAFGVGAVLFVLHAVGEV